MIKYQNLGHYFQTNPLGNDLIKMGTSGPKCQRGVTDAIFGRPGRLEDMASYS
jgi:hypothetical protein